MEITITEKCSVPVVDVDKVPNDVFVYLCAAYSDWLNYATKREVDRLKAAGELQSGFMWKFAIPRIAT
jgi:hypothetical protein